jgi:hypothetical protein
VGTSEGVLTDENARTLGTDGSIVPGLYAAVEIAGALGAGQTANLGGVPRLATKAALDSSPTINILNMMA